YAFTDWNGFSPDYKFVGLDNFLRIATDPDFRTAIINTAIWMVAALVLPALMGLLLALMINASIPAAGVFKSIFYLPICLSGVIVGQIWIWIYQPSWGLLDAVIAKVIGVRHFDYAWLAEPATALGSVIIAWSWVQTGMSMVIFLAGLTAIPRDLIEAADIDGVSPFRRTLHIVLPMLRPATIVVVALSVINALKGFDMLYVMTGGGPFHSSSTLALLMYEESFKKYRVGYGSAIAVVLFLIALSIIVLYFRQLRKMDEIHE
ncbi:MAG: sugar ABC transporter permease, partial [Rhizobiales bacterium]|nr:sugar ABC transporter permease [Hyphomicrobiales bacterium]